MPADATPTTTANVLIDQSSEEEKASIAEVAIHGMHDPALGALRERSDCSRRGEHPDSRQRHSRAEHDHHHGKHPERHPQRTCISEG